MSAGRNRHRGRCTPPKRGRQLPEGVTAADAGRIEDCADLAIAEGVIVIHAATGIVVVPDVVMAEAEAAGLPCPRTYTLGLDGRTVYLYRAPEVPGDAA